MIKTYIINLFKKTYKITHYYFNKCYNIIYFYLYRPIFYYYNYLYLIFITQDIKIIVRIILILAFLIKLILKYFGIT